jgi:hypothetical protein
VLEQYGAAQRQMVQLDDPQRQAPAGRVLASEIRSIDSDIA